MYRAALNSKLEFVRLVDVKEQVVDGKMYYLSFEANDAGNIKLYEAIVLVIPWRDNYREVEVFKAIDEAHVGSPEHNPFNLEG
ncbi:Proteinase inhibitor I25, cystatin [Cynara cardunculus var. scolymus]|uniref:Cysteine proteinase inhibitor n=1 Tax=Cynara cardunculus var. scolymus TaxID=59895 RepID=A0A118K1V3_CYNCS|nr:Proteinase inhibitor I25, cystatin [Cynara cardunculus var. scolymus]